MLYEDNIIAMIDAETGEITERHLILWIAPDQQRIVTLDLAAKSAWPAESMLEVWEAYLESGSAKLDGRSVPERILFDGQISEQHRTIRDKRWTYVADLVEQIPHIYLPHYRRTLISAVAKQHGVFRSTIVSSLQRYWRRGRCKNALLPDYDRCGGRDKSKACGEQKRGRPRKHGRRQGINVSDVLAKKMAKTGRLVFGSARSSKTMVQAYNRFIDEECMTRFKDPVTGLEQRVLKTEYEEHGVPTLEQFKYWADKPELKVLYQRKRRGLHYERNSRPLLGTATSRTIGPGSRYEIDATIADIYLSSEIDRAPIMRPTVYFVTDVFTRLIVAVTATLEPPCWKAAMAALLTAAMNKVEYCKRYDIDIEPEDWPKAGLPATLLHDGGELTAQWADTLINNFNVRFEKASAFRPDWKGLVESTFNVRARAITTDEPGSIPNEYQKIRGGDHRLRATYTLKEFTQMLIWDVLAFNNTHELKKYDADRDVLADSVPLIPTELWHWGVANRCAPREFPIEKVRAALLPHKRGRVTKQGIQFRNCHYSCDLAATKEWYDIASTSGTRLADVHYDDRYTDEVYLRYRQGNSIEFHKLNLLVRARGYKECSFWDLDDKLERDADALADRSHDNLGKKATYRDRAKRIKAGARKAKKEHEAKQAGQAQPLNIQENTLVERDRERAQLNPSLAGQKRGNAGAPAKTSILPPSVPMPRNPISQLRNPK